MKLTLAVALALASPGLSAMGLGPLQVKSGLNQPLVAEIPIISATPSELEKLDVRLASPEAFARIGLDRPGELTANLQFSVGKNSRGQSVILVTTSDRFSEPLLNFLIEADWGKGTVTREYTALIDPPYIARAIVQPMQQVAVAPIPQVAPPVAEPAPEPPPVAVVAPAPAQPEPEPARPAPPPSVVEAAPAPAPVVAAPSPAPVPEAQPVAPPRPKPVAAKPRPSSPPPAPKPAPKPVEAPAPAPTAPGQVGPVAPGQTLWSIANSVRPDAAISVNQMMLALLRSNPDAFIGDNVNLLRQGSVLRVPGQDEVTRLSAAQAAELVNQQAAAWRNPRAPVPQPAESSAPSQDIAAAAPKPAPAKPLAARPSRPSGARLEIVPPSGNAAARGAQSGAAAGAGGTELRAELTQAREDLAAKTAEVTELQSRVADLEKQQADRQHLIELQNSQMKAMQDRLAQLQAAQASAPADAASAAATPDDAAAAPAEPAKPWYLNPFVLGGGGLVLLGGLVLAMRRSRPKAEAEAPGRRLSDDEALRTSMAKTREAGQTIRKEPAKAPVAPRVPVDAELESRLKAVRSRPQDLESHLSLLRLYHARGNAADYEVAAQAMRAHVPSTMDPRWREAVVMGASLMPGNSLFGQAGWNSPRFNEPEPRAATAEPAAVVPVPKPTLPTTPAPVVENAPAAVKPPATPKVFDFPQEADPGSFGGLGKPEPELNLDDEAAVLEETFGSSMRDIHRDEARLQEEDEGSATRIELAKAYLDIGDLDGARSMLEEVLAEGGPNAKAEAARLLKELG